MTDRELLDYCENHLRTAPQPRFTGQHLKALARLAGVKEPVIRDTVIIDDRLVRLLCAKARERLEEA